MDSLPAKLFACNLAQHILDWAKASGSRAVRHLAAAQQVQPGLVLRALQYLHRRNGRALWARFVASKKAYNSVRWARLWTKLQALGVSNS